MRSDRSRPRSYGEQCRSGPALARRVAGHDRCALLAPAGAGAARPAGEDRGAGRFADRRLTACRPRRPFRRSSQAALKAKGIAADVVNAGVSGDTASGGLGRLDWSVPHGHRCRDPGARRQRRAARHRSDSDRAALDSILSKLDARHIAVLLAGMRAPRNMGADYVRRHSTPSIRRLPRLMRVVFYPFFLDGVADRRQAQSTRRHASRPPPASTSSSRVSCPRSKS